MKNRFVSDLSSSTSIFAASDTKPKSIKYESWFYENIEFAYKLNVKSKMKVFSRFCLRSSNIKDEFYIYFGFSTNLNNKYYDL